MLNKKLIKIVIRTLSTIFVVGVFFMGYFLGDGVRKNIDSNKIETKNKTNNKVEKNNIESELREQTINFLIAYYTKKDLGENRDRYKPYLTEGMYNAVIAEEDKATNKAYKGYIVDWEYEGADIFINQETKEVLVEVRYKNTTLAIKDDRSKQTIGSNKVYYKLAYTNVDNKLLINKMEQITIEQAKERS